MRKLVRIMAFLRFLLRAAEVAALVAVALLALSLRQVAKDVDVTVKDADAAAKEVKQRVIDTSQNTNAVLIQLGLASDEARRASIEQRKYLGQMSRQGVALLGDARHTVQTLDQTIAKLGTDSDALSASAKATIDNLNPVLDQSTKTLASANTLIADPDIPKAIKSLSETSQNTAQATASLAAAAGDVQKKVHELTKPASLVKSILSSLLGWAAQVATIFK